MRRQGLATLALCGLLAACSSRPDVLAAPATPSTTTTAPAVTTSPAPAVTTTAPPLTPAAVTPPVLQPGKVAVRTPTGVLALWLGNGPFGGTLVRTPCTRDAVVAHAEPVTGVDVLLDPGHGGLDPGAEDPTGRTEKEINLDVALRVRDLLIADGRVVALTRDGDWFRSVADRGLLAAAIRPKVFVSIHHNSGADAPSTRGPGTEVYYQHNADASKRLGGLVWEEVNQALSRFPINWTSGANQGVRWRSDTDGTDFYGVLRNAGPVPAVLVEGAYMSGTAEAPLMATAEFRAAEAAAVARGIERWLTTDAPGSGFKGGFVAGGTASTPDLSKCVDPRLE